MMRFHAHMPVMTLAIAATIAQSAAGADAGSQPSVLEEIVVTTQRRPQLLREVPISISVVQPEQLRENHVRDFADVAILTPGFIAAPNYIGIRNSSIRGISNNAFGFSEDPSIALYVDGVYQGRQGSQTSTFYDVQGVEVIKGSQATLFGRSSIAGAINVALNKPVQEAERFASFGLGDRNRLRIEGMVNAPLNDTWAIRAAVYSEQEDGFVENVNGGDDLMPTDIRAARVSIRRAGTSVDNTFMLSAEQREMSGVLYKRDGLPDFTVDQTLRGRDSKSNGDNVDAVNQLTYDITPHTTLSSITGWRKVTVDYAEDYDGLSQVIFGPFAQSHEDQMFSEDLRLVISRDSGAVLVAGLSGYTEKREASAENTLTTLALLSGGVVNPALLQPNDYSLAYMERGFFEGRNKGWSVYADTTIPVLAKLKLTGGVRYNYDQKEFTMNILNPATMPENAAAPFAGAYYLWGFWTSTPIEGTKSWDDVSFRAALDYALSDEATAYLSWSQGWKAGGFDTYTVNAPGFPFFFGRDASAFGATLRPFEPESSDSYEFGVKARALDGRLQYNLASYYFVYRDLQKSINQGGRPALTNVGRAEAWGVEGDFAFSPAPSLRLSGGFAYNDTEVTDDPVKPNQVGLPLNRAPQWQVTAGADVRFPAPLNLAGDVFGGVVYSYRDRFRTDDTIKPLVESATLVNVRVGYESADETYRLTLFADNVFDEFTYSRVSVAAPFSSPVTRRSVFGKPRTLGVDFSVRF